MALPTSTTLSAAVTQNDTAILLASITDIAAGVWLKIDQEMMLVLSVGASASVPVSVRRGQEGTGQVAHAITVQVIAGASPTNLVLGDFPQTLPGAPNLGAQGVVRSRQVKNYATAGAITLPTPGTDMIAIIDGTNALAMTVAAPSKLNDGDMLAIVGNGKAAHTVSLTAGVGLGAGGSGVDVGTFASGGQQCIVLMAANAVWVPFGSFMGGTSLANVTVTWA